MRKTLEILNRLESDGVFERYAIGGAVAAIFYIEPFSTQDLDIYIPIRATEDPLLSLGPI